MGKSEPMLVKVCGMNDPECIRAVGALAPSMMGFIFYDRSPRSAIGLDPDALRILPGSVTPVGVFVNPTYTEVMDRCRRFGISTVQLHGGESPTFCTRLRSRGLRVMKAVGIGPDHDWQSLRPYIPEVDMFVLDTQTAAYGGSGRKFDWRVTESWPFRTPYLLSGGIGPDDSTAVMRARRPMMAGVDLNSRFEISPGIKDAALLAKFINQLHNTDY